MPKRVYRYSKLARIIVITALCAIRFDQFRTSHGKLTLSSTLRHFMTLIFSQFGIRNVKAKQYSTLHPNYTLLFGIDVYVELVASVFPRSELNRN